MIKVSNVTKYYGKFLALDNINFEVNEGEIVAFLGPNGAGKTTTMRIITGFMSPSQGDVYINGIDIFDEMEEAKKCIGYLPENPPLYPDLTVQEYLKFVAELKLVEKNKINKRVDEVMEMTGVTERRNTLIAFLSKGYRQRVGIAQSIVNSPSVLIMDEPSVGLDPTQVIDIRALIKNLAKIEKRTVILSTHLLAEASQICEKVVIINDGKIVAVDKIDDLQQNKNEYHIFATVLRNQDKLKNMIGGMSPVKTINLTDNQFEIIADEDLREQIAKTIVENNGGLIKLDQRLESLEEIFVKLVK